MKKKNSYIFMAISIIMLFSFCTGQKDIPVLEGEYLGMKPPGETPELFAPGRITTHNHESNIVFSPDGKEVFWSVMHQSHRYSALVIMKKENGKWTKPEIAPFSGKYLDADGVYSPDGNRLFFTSNRPKGDSEEIENYDIWVVDREGPGWGTPINLDSIINTGKLEVNPSLSAKGTLYFVSDREGGEGGHDIYFSIFENGRYKDPVNIGDSINTANFESSPYVSPDESYLIYNSFHKDKSKSGLYISFRNTDGTWTKGQNMGTIINDKEPSMFATVSFDRKYLFFTSQKVPYLPYEGNPLNYDEVMKMFNSPQNGSGDIYWIDAKIIEELEKYKGE